MQFATTQINIDRSKWLQREPKYKISLMFNAHKQSKP